MNIAIYARVSTNQIDSLTGRMRQNPETQLQPLRAYAAQRGWMIFHEYVDRISSAKVRPQLNQMMDDARKRKFKAVLVWKFDRFARSSKHLILSLEEFNSLGIDFVSYSENIDTSSPIGKAMFAVIAALAELERNLIIERVTAGVSRVRARGGDWGRRKRELPPVPATGSLREKAKAMGCGVETVRRRMKEGAL